ncbi:hypothetical protein [Sphingomonas sp. SRS2]|uniref:hypothetical protein n=1 Tax=Sphingomonas sp. SRS2 TaxID=133190 RepID=UPI00061844FC|nr:hypothetical protein [Sphingomonas sp. SRS2]KKC23857.1 hypothetical protein WP12_22580 [Sphingomonas sp. SRS2]
MFLISILLLGAVIGVLCGALMGAGGAIPISVNAALGLVGAGAGGFLTALALGQVGTFDINWVSYCAALLAAYFLVSVFGMRATR